MNEVAGGGKILKDTLTITLCHVYRKIAGIFMHASPCL